MWGEEARVLWAEWKPGMRGGEEQRAGGGGEVEVCLGGMVGLL